MEKTFGLKNRRTTLFSKVQPIEPSEDLKKALQTARELPVKSEKARSEMIVLPILLELRNLSKKAFTIYSGDLFNVDEARGLKGECDFILAKDTGSFDVSFPIFHIVEAKKNDIEIGIPQCAAQLMAAKIFNQENNAPRETIFGCVTTGKDWVFLKLEDELLIDTDTYYLGNVETLLGVFQSAIGTLHDN
ncbi:MAG: hypothetical protein ACKVUS_01205 [Saprospiraceae bacterium]